ncbi:hypothetical protein BKM20_24950 [Pseudomonas avellanae]|uniref:Uncharacterized protein n=2 Tax=Pseudomonas avellanae TaxID=46257 RepID=A0AAD0DVJ3_9PSED|nr:hypothetical protein BKM03_05915 [Pseudomonas avellanae]KWS68575.1 hypothetical protein AL055_01035 [Pseudomonas amygdali pv. morsprunorum]PHN37297.1 hypothetical protein AO261_18140 [Pseudomonas avellanae]POC83452.1 hypothetical protein BKM26_25095 [Pseudomonas avellanae]POD01341.1 hypothetical protein BKM20_24950 [Pseudomonas avellanae]
MLISNSDRRSAGALLKGFRCASEREFLIPVVQSEAQVILKLTAGTSSSGSIVIRCFDSNSVGAFEASVLQFMIVSQHN